MAFLRRILPEWLKRPLRAARRLWRRRFSNRRVRHLAMELDRMRESREIVVGRLREAQAQRDAAREQLRDAWGDRSRLREEKRALRRRLVRFGIEAGEQKTETTDARILVGDPGLRTLAHYPAGTYNPFMALLYSRVSEFGFDSVALDRPEAIARLPRGSVLHLHWTRAAQLGATTEEEARASSREYLRIFEDFVAQGGVLIWTIHEPIPHDCAFPAVEADLRERLAELAAGVHLLHPSTLPEIGGRYHVDPDKTFVVRHPLYTGVYPHYGGRAAARARLGLPDDAKLVLCFGSIRPYKGFDRVVKSLPDLRERTGDDVRVLITGLSLLSDEIDRLRDVIDGSPWITLAPTAVPDRDVQFLFEAADVVALPYRYIHNSGVLMLGLTFGRVCVVPDNAISRDAVPSGLVVPFDAASDAALSEALVEALARSETTHTPAPGSLELHDPATIARDFAERVSEIVDRTAV